MTIERIILLIAMVIVQVCVAFGQIIDSTVYYKIKERNKNAALYYVRETFHNGNTDYEGWVAMEKIDTTKDIPGNSRDSVATKYGEWKY